MVVLFNSILLLLLLPDLNFHTSADFTGWNPVNGNYMMLIQSMELKELPHWFNGPILIATYYTKQQDFACCVCNILFKRAFHRTKRVVHNWCSSWCGTLSGTVNTITFAKMQNLQLSVTSNSNKNMKIARLECCQNRSVSSVCQQAGVVGWKMNAYKVFIVQDLSETESQVLTLP